MSLNTDEEINLVKGQCAVCRAIIYDDDSGHVEKNGSLFCSGSCEQETTGERKQFQIVIEGSNYEEVQALFEEIQNKFSLYDNCVLQEVDPQDTIVDDDRQEETGILSWNPEGGEI